MLKVNLCRLPYNVLCGIKKSPYPLWAGYLHSNACKENRDIRLVDGETIDFNLNDSILFKSSLINRAGVAFFPKYFYSPQVYFSMLDDEYHPAWDIYIEKVLENDPDVLAFSAYTSNFRAMMNVARRIKRRKRDISMLLGGIHVTAAPEETAKYIPEIDYYCIGEGERTFDEFLDAIEQGHDPARVPGIYVPTNPGKYRARSLIDDLDSIRCPSRELAPLHLYRPEFRIYTSRGCPFNCNFCSSQKMWTRRVRFHSPDYVIRELRELSDKYGAFRVIFSDDTYSVNRRRVSEISNRIVENGLNDLHYHIGARVETLDLDTIKLLARSGVKSISLGIESGSPRIQELISKKYNREQVVSTIKAINAHGIKTLTYYMIGHPEETEEDVELSRKLISDSRPTKVFLNTVQPLPGTVLYQQAQEKGFDISPENSSKMDFYTSPAINLTRMDIQTLQKQIDSLNRFVTSYSLRGKIIQAMEYLALLLKKKLKRAFSGGVS